MAYCLMNNIFVLSLLTGVMACQQTSKQPQRLLLTYEPTEYSKMFGVAKTAEGKTIFTIHQQDTTWYPVSNQPNTLKVVVLSSVFSAYFSELNCQNQLVGVDNIHYYNDPQLLDKFNKGQLLELGSEGQIDEEKLWRLKPDLVVGSSFNQINAAFIKRMKRRGIQYIICDNFKEQHPLARAEWIKFFGALMQRQTLSDSLFKLVKTNYQNIQTAIHPSDYKPLVMTDAKFGETWNIPGGQSYTAQLIKDAGGHYVFQDKADKFSYPLSMEVVIKSANHADVWIHTNQHKTLQQMAEADKRYQFFKPFKTKQVFNNNQRENPHGGNDFWEKGVVRPDIILQDLHSIFLADSNRYDSLLLLLQVKIASVFLEITMLFIKIIPRERQQAPQNFSLFFDLILYF
jgi:iron complex transport system substrate-binding protein